MKQGEEGPSRSGRFGRGGIRRPTLKLSEREMLTTRPLTEYKGLVLKEEFPIRWWEKRSCPTVYVDM